MKNKIVSRVSGWDLCVPRGRDKQSLHRALHLRARKLEKVDPRRFAVIKIFRECAIPYDQAAATFRVNHAVDERPATEASK